MFYSSDRRFKIWDYNVSHNQLLLRSPRTPEINTNIDFVFWGVEYIDLPTSFVGISLEPPERADMFNVERSIGKPCDISGVYCVVSGEQRHFVLASGFKVLENQLDIFETSLYYFSGTDKKRDIGETLAHS